MNSLKTMWGVLCYEYRMQVRRPVLWLTFLGFALWMGRTMIIQVGSPFFSFGNLPTLQLAAALTLLMNWLAPLAVGILLADRLVRDRRTRVEELFNTLPGTLKLRLSGKYLGTLLATLTPAFLMYLLLMGIATSIKGNPGLITACLLCYVVIVLPGMLFVAAFSLACPIVIWTPLYMFLFFGYWFWGNLLAPGYGLPTLSGTILTPVGSFIGASLFKVSTYGGIASSPTIDGIASMVLLVGIAVLILVVLYQFLRFEQARQ